MDGGCQFFTSSVSGGIGMPAKAKSQKGGARKGGKGKFDLSAVRTRLSEMGFVSRGEPPKGKMAHTALLAFQVGGHKYHAIFNGGGHHTKEFASLGTLLVKARRAEVPTEWKLDRWGNVSLDISSSLFTAMRL